ncbi:MAG: class I SAM-dependent methyltransferase [Acidimicrobiales bacterium]
MTGRVSAPTGNVYDKYESEHGIERRLMARFLRCLDAALPASAPGRVLEIGSGEGVIAGHVARRFPEATIVGVDLSDDDLARHWRERGLRGTFGDAARLPFPEGSFDLVLAIEVLEHLDDPAAALAEIGRVARGSVILSVPREPLWRIGNIVRRRYLPAWGNTPGHVQHWGSRSFRGVVSRHLRVVGHWRPFPWTMILATPWPSRPAR